MTMELDINPSDIKSSRKADGRGRITLGAEYSDKTVTIAVLDVEEPDE